MSINLDNVLEQIFVSEVQHKFQEKSELRGTVRIKNAKGAEKVQFPLMGKGRARQRTSVQTPVVPMDIEHTPKIATVTNWEAPEFTDIFKNNQVSFDERRELVQTVGMALGRQLDQIIIDQFDATSFTKTVATNISGSADNLTVEAIKDAARQLDLDGVPNSDRFFVCHASGFHHLLDDDKTTSSDFVRGQALETGRLAGFYGFTIVMLGDRDEGGLPQPTGTTRSNWAFHKSAMGLALNMDIKTTVDWVPTHAAHLVLGLLSAGAVVIDPTGVVEITTDES